MELEDRGRTRRSVEDVLARDEDPIAKVQDIVDLGFDEEVANDIVERYQIGQSQVVYYEQLPGSKSD
ncbi:MAG TPA: hypothetical protein VLE72_04470 [Candidatus Saccharimonadales bacterium]|nr:hypothetical protein [Candidatus Saccharimonadales bacterium]